jgi:hypothetical protein
MPSPTASPLPSDSRGFLCLQSAVACAAFAGYLGYYVWNRFASGSSRILLEPCDATGFRRSATEHGETKIAAAFALAGFGVSMAGTILNALAQDRPLENTDALLTKLVNPLMLAGLTALYASYCGMPESGSECAALGIGFSLVSNAVKNQIVRIAHGRPLAYRSSESLIEQPSYAFLTPADYCLANGFYAIRKLFFPTGQAIEQNAERDSTTNVSVGTQTDRPPKEEHSAPREKDSGKYQRRCSNCNTLNLVPRIKQKPSKEPSEERRVTRAYAKKHGIEIF